VLVIKEHVAIEKNRKKITNFCLFEWIPIAASLAYLVWRVHFGVDFTDESWYVADAYIVSQGAIPYLDNWTQTPGYALPLALFFKAYSLLCGTEGMVLFSRLLYVVWKFCVCVISIIIVKTNLDDELPISWFAPIILLNDGSLFDINYNSIGFVYFPLVLVIIFAAWTKPDKRAFFYGLIVGIIGARAFIGTPYLIVPCLFLFIALICCRKNGLALGIFVGLLLSTIIVIAWCCFCGGVKDFVYGMFAWLSDYGYFKIERRKTYYSDIVYLIKFLLPLVVYAAILMLLRITLMKHEDKFRLALGAVGILFLLVGVWEAVRSTAGVSAVRALVKYGWFVPLGMLFLKDKSLKHCLLIFACVLYFLLYCTSSTMNIYGFGSREYWLIVPCVLAIISIYFILREIADFRKNAKFIFYFCILLLCLVQIKCTNEYVYRDGEIRALNTHVDQGIWKGCYTTENRAQQILEMEGFIRERTSENDKVLFQDWASFAYMMNDGQAFTPSALDPCSYTYGVNNPEILYDYFYMKNSVPNKIFYVDYGRDDCLSIEDEEWKFNDFVKSYYNESSAYNGDNFRIIEYTVINFEEALEYAVENASKLPYDRRGNN